MDKVRARSLERRALDPPARAMISKKVCMVGSFAVGKTSLVQRFVKSVYDDQYLTTVGVKIDRKIVAVGDAEVNLMLWDLAGEDAFTDLRLDHVRGSSGFILVADGTRPNTLDVALSLRDRIRAVYGALPFVLALNKADLHEEWCLDEERIATLERSAGWSVVRTSARTGDSVEHLFSMLAEKLIGE